MLNYQKAFSFLILTVMLMTAGVDLGFTALVMFLTTLGNGL